MLAGFTESRDGAYKDRPVLVWQGKTERSVYVRRLRWAVVALLASGGVWWMLGTALVSGAVMTFPIPFPGINAIKAATLIGGRVVAMLVLMFSSGRAIINLVLAVRRPTETLRFYDEGFAWERKNNLVKYRWNAVKTVIENPRGWYWRGKPRLQWGGVTFKLRDGSVYKVTGAHGDLLEFIGAVQPHYGAEMGVQMGQRLRQQKGFKVHPQVTVMPAGLVLGDDRRIGWKRLHLGVEGRELVLGRMDDAGTVKVVERIPTHKVENLAGFIELAEATAETFQRPNPYAR
jgi:hypothetical protein